VVKSKLDCCDNYKAENTQYYIAKMENLEKEGIDTAIAFPFGKSNKAFKAQAAERVIDDQETA
jgi:deoxyribose-phosphate aldolase